MMRVVFFVFFGLAHMTDMPEVDINEDLRIVTLTCPDPASEWGTQSGKVTAENDQNYSFPYEVDNVGMFYYCDNGIRKYNFYFKGKICENCFELDGKLMITIITGDLLVTGGVILLVYHRAQRKPGSPPAAAANHQDSPREPESNYEDLSPRTRDNATYAGVHRTG